MRMMRCSRLGIGVMTLRRSLKRVIHDRCDRTYIRALYTILRFSAISTRLPFLFHFQNGTTWPKRTFRRRRGESKKRDSLAEPPRAPDRKRLGLLRSQLASLTRLKRHYYLHKNSIIWRSLNRLVASIGQVEDFKPIKCEALWWK